LPGDTLRLAGEVAEGPGALPEAITAVSLDPLLLSQGKTVVIQVSGGPGLALSGSLAGRELRFSALEGGYVALQGVHAMTEPGLYPLTLKGVLPGGAESDTLTFAFSQSVLIHSG